MNVSTPKRDAVRVRQRLLDKLAERSGSRSRSDNGSGEEHLPRSGSPAEDLGHYGSDNEVVTNQGPGMRNRVGSSEKKVAPTLGNPHKWV